MAQIGLFLYGGTMVVALVISIRAQGLTRIAFAFMAGALCVFLLMSVGALR